jgi:hypothetical protein
LQPYLSATGPLFSKQVFVSYEVLAVKSIGNKYLLLTMGLIIGNSGYYSHISIISENGDEVEEEN